MFRRVATYILRSFELPIDEPVFRRTVELCRVTIGLGMLHRYVDIAGFLVATPDPVMSERIVLIAVAASLGVTLGLLTPLALATLFYFTLYTPFGFTLGDQMVGIVMWVLLFSGAGRRWSLDAALIRFPLVSKLLAVFYALDVPFSTRSFALLRLIVLFFYWSIAFGAMAFHFKDSLWIRGNVLQLLMVTPYMTDLAALMRAFRDAMPDVYDAVWRVAFVLDSVFELLLWPLCLFRWGRIFVALQWMGFIVVRGLFLNLGYLCWDELVLWLFVFTVHPWAVLSHRVGLRDRHMAPSDATKPRHLVLRKFAFFGVVICLYFSVVNFAQINAPGSSIARAFYPKTLFRVYGQGPVNVFNKEDMSMGAAELVIVETNNQGKVLRVVPYVDYEGGRLSYLRNDFMYFGIGVRWQRLSRAQQMQTAPAVARRVALVDSALQPEARTRYYFALLFTQRVEPYADYQRWTSSEFKGGFRFEISARELSKSLPPWIPAYDLPPGHLGEGARQEATLQRVRQLEAEGAFRSLPRFRFVGDPDAG
jgi:hypothetical protein